MVLPEQGLACKSTIMGLAYVAEDQVHLPGPALHMGLSHLPSVPGESAEAVQTK